jgi:hypothetical protein
MAAAVALPVPADTLLWKCAHSSVLLELRRYPRFL